MSQAPAWGPQPELPGRVPGKVLGKAPRKVPGKVPGVRGATPGSAAGSATTAAASSAARPTAPAPAPAMRARAAVRRVPADPRSAPTGVAEVEIRRSARRTRSVSAYREGSRVVVLVPARFSGAEEDRWVARMLQRLARSAARAAMGDEDLQARAALLAARYLPGVPPPASVRWTARQQLRWGSCTPVDRSIRLSERLQGMPRWVVDYVLVHELAHLVHADHGAGFAELVARYPLADRARGFLDGVSFVADTSGSVGAGPDAPTPDSSAPDAPAPPYSGWVHDPESMDDLDTPWRDNL